MTQSDPEPPVGLETSGHKRTSLYGNSRRSHCAPQSPIELFLRLTGHAQGAEPMAGANIGAGFRAIGNHGNFAFGSQLTNFRI
jgi:hypothetical protein